MIKVIAPGMAENVIDRSIQAHGGGGMCQDFPMAGMMAWARVLRLVAGPDEVHVRAVSRLEMKDWWVESEADDPSFLSKKYLGSKSKV